VLIVSYKFYCRSGRTELVYNDFYSRIKLVCYRFYNQTQLVVYLYHKYYLGSDSDTSKISIVFNEYLDLMDVSFTKKKYSYYKITGHCYSSILVCIAKKKLNMKIFLNFRSVHIQDTHFEL
jgi:hypothetical protein